MPDAPQFLFVSCQIGAETAIKGELARRWPDARGAYSRPGFLTFKLPGDHLLRPGFELPSVFGRSYGFSLGAVRAESTDALAEAFWKTLEPRLAEEGFWKAVGAQTIRRLHVWPRDAAVPGDQGFEPGVTPEAIQARQAILRLLPNHPRLAIAEQTHHEQEKPSSVAKPKEAVLDCVLVQPDEWWVGYHRAEVGPSQWAGGITPLELPGEAVSRAWLKMEEALRWSRLPIPPGARWAEIGSAPGGATQALLNHGLTVVGIDPAEMAPVVLQNPHFIHIRKRASQVSRREFRKIRWLSADMNVAPSYTLDAVEAIVTHREVNIRGMLLTLKLFEWELAEHVPEYLDRVRGWGYNLVQARQLVHNRQEICLAALQKPFVRKSSMGS